LAKNHELGTGKMKMKFHCSLSLSNPMDGFFTTHIFLQEVKNLKYSASFRA
jgi:hypothetical protein